MWIDDQVTRFDIFQQFPLLEAPNLQIWITVATSLGRPGTNIRMELLPTSTSDGVGIRLDEEILILRDPIVSAKG